MRNRHGQALRRLSGERLTMKGAVILSHNHIALLHGLYDRPGGRVESKAEWTRAATPYFARFRSGPAYWPLYKSMATINPAWVSEAQRGRCIEVTLTERGRAIVERRIASHIFGRGPYEGLPSGSPEERRATLPDDILRRIAEYTDTFGIPLLDEKPATAETQTIFAITTGLDRPFRLLGLPEIERRGPRGWHYKWTRQKIESGSIPAGFLDAYRAEDEEDLTCYLRELIEQPDAFLNAYAQVYRGRTFLSDEMMQRWLNEEIDLSETDVESEELSSLLRGMSQPYLGALSAIPEDSMSWSHPVTGKSLGSVHKTRDDFGGPAMLTATSPAALSCLQAYLAVYAPRLRVVTQYEQGQALS